MLPLPLRHPHLFCRQDERQPEKLIYTRRYGTRRAGARRSQAGFSANSAAPRENRGSSASAATLSASAKKGGAGGPLIPSVPMVPAFACRPGRRALDVSRGGAEMRRIHPYSHAFSFCGFHRPPLLPQSWFVAWGRPAESAKAQKGLTEGLGTAFPKKGVPKPGGAGCRGSGGRCAASWGALPR